MELKSWIRQHQVLIVGCLMAVLMASIEFIKINQGAEFRWPPFLWAIFIAGLTWAGKNLRGQAASMSTAVLTTLANMSALEFHPNIQWLLLILTAAVAVLGVFFSGPAKSREYEHTEPIIEAKKQAAALIEEKKEARADAKAANNNSTS